MNIKKAHVILLIVIFSNGCNNDVFKQNKKKESNKFDTFSNSKKVKMVNEKGIKKNTETIYIIKDSSLYSKFFLKKFKEKHNIYKSVFFYNDSIIINNDLNGSLILPKDLPLDREITYKNKRNGFLNILILKRINLTSLKYKFIQNNDTKYFGTVHLDPIFYYGSGSIFVENNGNVFGANIYNNENSKNSVRIKVGIGNTSFVAFESNNDTIVFTTTHQSKPQQKGSKVGTLR